MVITAFDLGSDPYFVFVLKAWIMQKTDGGWFGETLQGFAGWMAVSLLIVGSFQALAAPRRSPPPADGLPLAVLVPILIYASGLVFQVLLGHPIEVISDYTTLIDPDGDYAAVLERAGATAVLWDKDSDLATWLEDPANGWEVVHEERMWLVAVPAEDR